MAKICMGSMAGGKHFKIYRLCILLILFGLTLCSQMEIKEISELIENFKEVPKEYLTQKHEILRRAAIQPTPTIQPTPRIVSLSQKQSASQPTLTLPRLSSPAVKPNKTVASLSKTAWFVTAKVPTSGYTTAKNTTSIPTTQSQTTNRESPKPTHKPSTTTLPTGTENIPDPEHHKYYTSHYYRNGKKWWFNLDDQSKKSILHTELSKNIKFSDVLRISFDFPYYGHLINNVTITNKGYLFLGERLHVFNASAQYAAPLMADFGPDLHYRTSIRYIDTGDRFTVEWANMRLRKQSPDKEFSFQCSIFKNGSLIFAYKKIPLQVTDIRTSGFFVRVGLSDTYRIERVVRNGKYKGKTYSKIRYIFYYLYDKVELKKEKVLSGSAFLFTPLPNCVMFNSCDKCVNTQTSFSCKWCPNIRRCSDGIDRHRQTWENAGCLADSVSSCPNDSSELSGGEIAVIVIVLLLMIFVIAWFVYAYLHPQTKSGLCLIKYGNPTKWCRNSSGERQNTSTDGRISFKTMPFESNT